MARLGRPGRSSSWPEDSPTSATCRCAPAAGSRRRCAGPALDVIERDVDADLLTTLREERPLCVVPMLHGETGEDGAIREVFELLGVAYVGAPPASCRTAFDKPVAKAVAARAGILTPESVCLPHETFRELGAPRGDGRARGAARPADDGQARQERLGARLLGGPHRRGAAVGDGERLRLRRRRAAGAVRRGARGGRAGHRRRLGAPGAARGGDPRRRRASTTTRRATRRAHGVRRPGAAEPASSPTRWPGWP